MTGTAPSGGDPNQTGQLPPLFPPSQHGGDGSLPKILQNPSSTDGKQPLRHPWGNKDWPEPKSGQHLHVERDTLRQLARKLNHDLERYKGTTRHLQKAGQLSAADVGQWPAAQDLHATAKQSHQGLTQLHDAFITSYADLISRIERMAGVYDTTEQDTVAEIRKTEGQMHEPAIRRPGSTPGTDSRY